MKTVAILGGAGFIGSNLVRWYRQHRQKDQVTVFDNFWTGRLENLPAKTRYFHWDVGRDRDPHFVFDEVWHLASPASPVWYTPEPVRTIMANVGGAVMATKIVAPGGRLFFTSTSEVYGDPLVSPQPESYRGSVTTTGPRAAYDEGKRATEALLTGWWREQGRAEGVRLKIARIFNCYGPHTRADDGRAVSNFLTAALRGDRMRVHAPGTQTRCFGHVDDILWGMRELMWQTPDDFCGPLNIGLDEEISVIQLAEYVRDLTGAGYDIVDPTPDDPQQRRPDLTLCRQTIPDWCPTIHWTDGVESTLRWFRKQ